MGHKYIKEDEVFDTTRNGTVPKPTANDVSQNKFLRANGTWASGAGGSVVSADQIISSGTEIGGITIDGVRTPYFAPLRVYSAAEHVVGTWIDGKPIYERTITETDGNQGNGAISENVSSWGIRNMVGISGHTEDTNFNRVIPLIYRSNTTDAIGESICVFYRKATTLLEIRWRGITFGTAYINVQYTKSADYA